MLEGASLVMIYNGASTVALYDAGLAGKTLASGTLTYTLRLPRTYTEFLRYDNIGADGQIGFGREPTSSTSKEEAFVGATKIAGPGSNDNDSLWNGGVSVWSRSCGTPRPLISPRQCRRALRQWR